MKEKIILKNGKEANIVKQISNDSYLACYKGVEGESLFVINDEQISKRNLLPYIFCDLDDVPRKKKRRK